MISTLLMTNSYICHEIDGIDNWAGERSDIWLTSRERGRKSHSHRFVVCTSHWHARPYCSLCPLCPWPSNILTFTCAWTLVSKEYREERNLVSIVLRVCAVSIVLSWSSGHNCWVNQTTHFLVLFYIVLSFLCLQTKLFPAMISIQSFGVYPSHDQISVLAPNLYNPKSEPITYQAWEDSNLDNIIKISLSSTLFFATMTEPIRTIMSWGRVISSCLVAVGNIEPTKWGGMSRKLSKLAAVDPFEAFGVVPSVCATHKQSTNKQRRDEERVPYWPARHTMIDVLRVSHSQSTDSRLIGHILDDIRKTLAKDIEYNTQSIYCLIEFHCKYVRKSCELTMKESYCTRGKDTDTL